VDTQGHDIFSKQEIWESRIRSTDTYLPNPSDLVADEKRYKLKCLSLKSCGYISVISPRMLLNQRREAALITALDESQPEVWQYMQEPSDWRLGRIVPSIPREEQARLTGVFGMTMGWRGIYSERMIQEAVADGISDPGKGRFSGVLESTEEEPWTGFPSDDESDNASSKDLG